MFIRDDISDGFAFTANAFCTGGASGGHIFKYNEIGFVNDNDLKIWNKQNNLLCDFYAKGVGIFSTFHGSINQKVKKFLDVVKNF